MAKISGADAFYHIYPIGALGAEPVNDGVSAPACRMAKLVDWIPAVEAAGCTAVYLGPVFESERHGYDTVDYLSVDRRLGTNADLAALSESFRKRGIALVLDAVFNHVGRNHPFVRDVAARGSASPYASWIAGYDPGGPVRGGLPFGYEGWNGHYDLVKLDTRNGAVREYLCGVALSWIEDFGIAGLRLDAADCLDRDFLRLLGDRCRAVSPDFFLLGEAVHSGLYAPLLGECGLDSVTNYEAWKGLWSSYNDGNYFEIAWTLNRQFGPGGFCSGRLPYSFADNHDVDRAASLLRDPAGLYPLYGLLFAMPGIPSIYYGSEYALEGARMPGDDSPVRPFLDPAALRDSGSSDLARAVARFARARRESTGLCRGGYRQLAVDAAGIAFLREEGDGSVAVGVNGSPQRRTYAVSVPEFAGRGVGDLLDPSYCRTADMNGGIVLDIPPHWTRWLSIR